MRRVLWTLAVVLTALGAGASHAGDDEVEAGTTGTGIMGVITGLGSIHVNGHRIALSAGLEAVSSLGSRPAAELGVGETVVVEAAPVEGVLHARHIRNYYPLVAPVDAVSDSTLRLLGIELDVSEVAFGGLAAGDWVAVSGLWRGDSVVVSDLRPIAPRDTVVVNGSFTQGSGGVQRVGPFALDGRYVAHAEAGDQLRVVGTWSATDGTLSPSAIDAGLFAPDIRTLLIEGFMSQPDRRGAYSIYGSGIVVFTDDPAMRLPEERSVFCIDRTGPASITQNLSLGMSREARVDLLERRLAAPDAAAHTALPCAPAPQ